MRPRQTNYEVESGSFMFGMPSISTKADDDISQMGDIVIHKLWPLAADANSDCWRRAIRNLRTASVTTLSTPNGMHYSVSCRVVLGMFPISCLICRRRKSANVRRSSGYRPSGWLSPSRTSGSAFAPVRPCTPALVRRVGREGPWPHRDPALLRVRPDRMPG